MEQLYEIRFTPDDIAKMTGRYTVWGRDFEFGRRRIAEITATIPEHGDILYIVQQRNKKGKRVCLTLEYALSSIIQNDT